MKPNRTLDAFAHLTGNLTRWFPQRGARALDGILYPLMGNDLVTGLFGRLNQKKLMDVPHFERLLVVSDIHIGDAVLFQTAVSALRDFFPNAQIDYAVKKSIDGIIGGNPDVTELWPVFTGGQFPNDRDVLCVQSLSVEYDAVFNFCPFLPGSAFPEPHRIFHFTSWAPVFVQNERKPLMPNHIAYQAHRFIYDLLEPKFPIQRARSFEGPNLHLSHEAIQTAEDFIRSKAGPGPEPILFFNPDTASPYTRVPFPSQSELLRAITDMPCRVLMGEGHTDRGIGERLLLTLPLWKRERIVLVPSSLALDAYAALIDHADVFISGDTGPLHIAAAYKRSKGVSFCFRNRTAVLSVFGATPPRLSGYDSSRAGYLASSQEAESFSYQSRSACRNITCMHKMGKSCDPRECFESVDIDRIVGDIKILFRERSRRGSPVKV